MGAPGGYDAPSRGSSTSPDPRPLTRAGPGLLELDGGAGALERAFAFSASSLDTFSSTGFGAQSTRSFASFRPEAREAADLLDDLDLLVAGGGEDDVELVLLLGRGRAAATAAPAAAATATGAAAVTPNSSSKAFRNSFSSRTVMFLKTSSSSVGARGSHHSSLSVSRRSSGSGLGSAELGCSARLGVASASTVPRPRGEARVRPDAPGTASAPRARLARRLAALDPLVHVAP